MAPLSPDLGQDGARVTQVPAAPAVDLPRLCLACACACRITPVWLMDHAMSASRYAHKRSACSVFSVMLPERVTCFGPPSFAQKHQRQRRTDGCTQKATSRRPARQTFGYGLRHTVQYATARERGQPRVTFSLDRERKACKILRFFSDGVSLADNGLFCGTLGVSTKHRSPHGGRAGLFSPHVTVRRNVGRQTAHGVNQEFTICAFALETSDYCGRPPVRLRLPSSNDITTGSAKVPRPVHRSLRWREMVSVPTSTKLHALRHANAIMYNVFEAVSHDTMTKPTETALLTSYATVPHISLDRSLGMPTPRVPATRRYSVLRLAYRPVSIHICHDTLLGYS
ncbi:hypothetical protein BAUCODRAFT_568523 [Baudoinia panamericana UAMH 10762]|uniref:Uncharacterized protein n=1 Tax=Baudoinia panamericana (strain UAMH 10762) TaxID=717646 RepID=M2LHI1_BAUPA|nr:uncharacterized protein BAUCODRAFT_568523 [Baudoinia panamericana UAMH 10762]EMC93622.1 hypothetical protein BAUCODRAFT_568523 [Baudoinia panamericana UAMH 10762]